MKILILIENLCLKSSNKMLKLIYLYQQKNSRDKISNILLKIKDYKS